MAAQILSGVAELAMRFSPRIADETCFDTLAFNGATGVRNRCLVLGCRSQY